LLNTTKIAEEERDTAHRGPTKASKPNAVREGTRFAIEIDSQEDRLKKEGRIPSRENNGALQYPSGISINFGQSRPN